MTIFEKIDNTEILLAKINQKKNYYVYVIFFIIFIVLFIYILKNYNFIYEIIIFLIFLFIIFLITYILIIKNMLSKIIITNKRFIYLENKNFFSYIEKEIFNDTIIEIKIIKKWNLEKFFNYWTLKILINNQWITFKNMSFNNLDIDLIIKKIKK